MEAISARKPGGWGCSPPSCWMPAPRWCRFVRLALCVELWPLRFRAHPCVIIPTALRLICALRSPHGMGWMLSKCSQGMGPRNCSPGQLVMRPPPVAMLSRSLDLPTIPALWPVGVARSRSCLCLWRGAMAGRNPFRWPRSRQRPMWCGSPIPITPPVSFGAVLRWNPCWLAARW